MAALEKVNKIKLCFKQIGGKRNVAKHFIFIKKKVFIYLAK
jgi:hypothetical protein